MIVIISLSFNNVVIHMYLKIDQILNNLLIE